MKQTAGEELVKQTYRLPKPLVRQIARAAKRERRALNSQVAVVLERGLQRAPA